MTSIKLTTKVGHHKAGDLIEVTSAGAAGLIASGHAVAAEHGSKKRATKRGKSESAATVDAEAPAEAGADVEAVAPGGGSPSAVR